MLSLQILINFVFLLIFVLFNPQNFLPDERLRIVHGAWNPEVVLKMVKSGIDIFDTSFPVLNAENGRALLFNFNVPNL